MSDVILLSSDDEEFSPPVKKPKISNGIGDCIVLSDEEDESRTPPVTDEIACAYAILQSPEPEQREIVSNSVKVKSDPIAEVVDLDDVIICEVGDSVQSSAVCNLNLEQTENGLGSDSENDYHFNVDSSSKPKIKSKSPEIEERESDKNSKITNGESETNITTKNKSDDTDLELKETKECSSENKIPLKSENTGEGSVKSKPRNENDVHDSQEPSSSVTDKSEDMQKMLADFIEICASSTKKEAYKKVILEKTKTFKKLLTKIMQKCNDVPRIENIIVTNRENVKREPSNTLVYFNNVFQELRHIYDTRNATELDPNKVKVIKKLDKTLTRLRRKIRELENAEVDWDDEEDSTYMQMQRYRERAAQVYNKFCEYVNEDPHYGKILFRRLDFADSKYNEINRMISRKFKNNIFPTYYDMHKMITKCVKDHDLNLSQAELDGEVKLCFKKLGILLQARRRLDLFENHRSFIESLDDPAKEDPQLNFTLMDNKKRAESKLEEICQKYTRLQEQCVETVVSGSSSNTDSDSEEETTKKT